MRVLVIGGGAREHALCWAISRSPLLTKLYCAPGNGGTAELAENVALDPMDFEACADWAERHAIDLTIVGPENYSAAASSMSSGARAARLRAERRRRAHREQQGLRQAADGGSGRADAARRNLRRATTRPSSISTATSGEAASIRSSSRRMGWRRAKASSRPKMSTRRARAGCFDGAAHGGRGGRHGVDRGCMTGHGTLALRADRRRAHRSRSRPPATTSAPTTATRGRIPAAWARIRRHASPRRNCWRDMEARILRPTVAALASQGSPFRGLLYAGLIITERWAPTCSNSTRASATPRRR